MKLKDVKKLTENREHLHHFVFEKWDGHEVEGLQIDPFDVLVKYHVEKGGHSDHPYGEGEAREYHGDNIHVVSVTANEDVVIMSDNADKQLDHVKDITTLHALVIGYDKSEILDKVKDAFPHAAVCHMGHKTAAAFFDFMEDHADDDVIVSIDASTEFSANPDGVALLKSILDGDEVSFKTIHVDRKFTFRGRIILVAYGDEAYSKEVKALSQLHPDPDYVATKVGAKKEFKVYLSPSIVNRCVLVDLSDNRTIPAGTRLQDIPGWEESHLDFFDEKAAEDYDRNR